MRRLEELKVRRREQKEQLRTWLRLKGAMSHLNELSGAQKCFQLEAESCHDTMKGEMKCFQKTNSANGNDKKSTLGGELKKIRAAAGRQYGELNFEAAHSGGSGQAPSTTLDEAWKSGRLDMGKLGSSLANLGKALASPESKEDTTAEGPRGEKILKRTGGSSSGAAPTLTAGATRWAVVSEMQRPDLGSIEMKLVKEEIRQLKRSRRRT